MGHYAINSVPFLTTIREKYVKNERFLEPLKMYTKVIRILLKGYLPIWLLPQAKLSGILSEVRKTIQKTNKDYDLVLSHLYLYYDMKLVKTWNRWEEKFNNTITSICAALYSETTNAVSN